MTSLDALADWARGEDDVLAVVLTGSRARPDPDLDGFSDYDVLLYVRDPDAFAASDASAARPTAEAYRETVDEFWWETLYVAKNLVRAELLPARYSAESVLRFRCLVPMLEWSVEAAHGWDLPIGPYGRRLRDHLPEAWRTGLDRTYFGADAEEGWDALLAMVELFEAAAEEVADRLGFEYPGERARKVVERLRGIRDDEETPEGHASPRETTP